jgi:hypothetical protein
MPITPPSLATTTAPDASVGHLLILKEGDSKLLAIRADRFLVVLTAGGGRGSVFCKPLHTNNYLLDLGADWYIDIDPSAVEFGFPSRFGTDGVLVVAGNRQFLRYHHAVDAYAEPAYLDLGSHETLLQFPSELTAWTAGTRAAMFTSWTVRLRVPGEDGPGRELLRWSLQ